ncbi:hypothetical protein Aple_037040 [Acrocarpospora pleiomorpha]|uniref:Uncharacterized protein n=1 Tax=Acrocarpospora pleiomorpha TaxID=90975 RepID=A0A5M3XR35_9ACTN|nr:hypothetical protein [Acrocarpospora pleiomorpha]GES20808.1 hypothetical protein Aple_037040 [Acrocarpospora pleiomorpha]
MTRTATKAATTLWAITALAALVAVGCDDSSQSRQQAATQAVQVIPLVSVIPDHGTADPSRDTGQQVGGAATGRR